MHARLFGTHNGELARQYQAAAAALADESKTFRHELLAFRQNNKDPLQELLRLRRPH